MPFELTTTRPVAGSRTASASAIPIPRWVTQLRSAVLSSATVRSGEPDRSTSRTLAIETRADARPQEDGIEGLREVVVGAHLDAPRDRVDLVERRKHHYRDVAKAIVIAHPAEDLHAVHLGHHHVEKYEVEVLL